MAQKRARSRTVLEHQQVPGLALNLDSPTIAKQNRRRKMLTVLVASTVFVVTPVVGIGTAAVLFNPNSGEGETQAASSLEVNDSIGKAAATLGINGWLITDPAPLPGGTIVSWDGFEVREAPAPEPGSNPNEVRATYVQEVHFFTVTDGTTLFDTTVLVHADPRAGAKMVGSPTLLPRPTITSGSWTGEVPWFGFISAPANLDIQPSVDDWADAFTSGSPKRLKQATGDPNAESSYVPITGVKSATARVVTTGVIEPESEDAPPPTWMLARVELSIIWNDAPALGPGQKPTVITYDLLVQGIDTATPRVVSWGGGGTGPSLTAYSVALDGVKLAEPGSTTTLPDPQNEISATDEEAETVG